VALFSGEIFSGSRKSSKNSTGHFMCYENRTSIGTIDTPARLS
jgi:ribulose-5-phosphate 4-epimerase/fuculose-1-phosphate aldolase